MSSTSIAVFVADCPHCSAENTTFIMRSAYSLDANDVVGIVGNVHRLFLDCPRCHGAVVLHGTTPGNVMPSAFTGDVARYLSYLQMFPRRTPIDVPANVPNEVARVFKQGVDNRRRGNLDTAAMAYRKSLDVATRLLCKKHGIEVEGTFYARIEELTAAGKLTQELAAWAHAVRIDGNEGAHDAEEPTKETVENLHNFTETFLLYAFTLPKMVEDRKSP